MEASATTLNITQNPAERVKKDGKRYGMHTHGANFNKFVAGCSECLSRKPDGKPGEYLGKKPRNRLSAEKQSVKTKELIESTQSELEKKAEELLMLLEAAQQRASTAEAAVVEKQDPLNALVQLMLRREAKTIEKEEDVEKRRLAAREDMLKVTREQLRIKEAMQASCGHTKENGKTARAGQVCNDKLYHSFCQRCFFTFPPVAPSREQMQG